MISFDRIPKEVLGRLLPRRLLTVEFVEEQWPGGSIRCETTADHLPTKKDIALIMTALRDGGDRLLIPNGNLRKSRIIETLDRCLRARVVADTDGRRDMAYIVSEYKDSGPGKPVLFRVGPGMDDILPALTETEPA